MNVLYNKEAGKYLGEEVDIRLVSSGRDLFKTYPEPSEELTAVLIGSPKYDLIEEQAQDDELHDVEETMMIILEQTECYWWELGWS